MNKNKREHVFSSPVDNLAFRRIVAAFLSLVALVTFAITPAFADDKADSQEDTSLISTSSIVDTQNLLGSAMSQVTDAVKKAKNETGVTILLMYLGTFNTKKSAVDWAHDQLNQAKPKPNTVLLALASQDGKLAVVASDNSQAWLKDKKTIAALSNAAAHPLVAHKTPDWPGAATALANEVIAQKKASDSAPMWKALKITGVVLLVLLGLAVVAFVVWLASRGVFSKQHAGRHSGQPVSAGTSAETSVNPSADSAVEGSSQQEAEKTDAATDSADDSSDASAN